METQLTSIDAQYFLTIFRNESTGYTVAKFKLYQLDEKEITVTGSFSVLQRDVIYHLSGTYVQHPRYGIQFAMSSYEKSVANDHDSVVTYLSGGFFPGIGRKTAELIVDALGDQAIDCIKENPSILQTISGLNKKKIDSIKKGIFDSDMDESSLFFTQLGVSMRNIMKIETIYGNEAVTIVKNNPYQLVEDIDGIGFATADKLAKTLAFEEDHPYRIRACILSTVLEQCMNHGDSYVDYQTLVKAVNHKFNFPIDLDDYLGSLCSDRQLMVEEERIYHHTQYDAEKGIVTFLLNFPYVDENVLPFFNLEDEINQLQNLYHITYEDKQKKAMESFFPSSFMILTGGPGTGKTTIVRGILSLYRKFYPEQKIALCAPTGRAAKRLSELSNVEACTIHRLLKWNLEANTFDVNENNPIDADLLIIDEFSMVDQWLFYNLLRACRNVKQILLIGDEDQLPSVGPGMVLADLIASNYFPCVRLEKIFRQSEGSGVVELAHEIRQGECCVIEDHHDIAFFSCLNYEVKDQIVRIVQNAFDKGYDLKDIQVLAPMYAGVAGIDSLNLTLQTLCNPSADFKRELKMGYRIFREHDKVLQLKNQPDDDVYNGDIGFIEEIIYANEDMNHQNRIVVSFDGIMVEYAGEMISNITHAYCISIHKSQGSEYPIVIMPILKDYRFMLQKRLIYTGVTRAKQSLVLLGDKEVLRSSIKKDHTKPRKTTLGLILKNFFE
ncbi:MAG: ATP-dependent RecD-like DNA helicase [Erysipelotrichaceae bacterium]